MSLSMMVVSVTSHIGQLAPGVGTRAKLAVGVAERPLGS